MVYENYEPKEMLKIVQSLKLQNAMRWYFENCNFTYSLYIFEMFVKA